MHATACMCMCLHACIALGTCKPQELRHCTCKPHELRHCIVRVCVCVPVCRRPEIAKLNGLKCDIFKDDTEAAIAATNQIIARNRKLFPHIGNSRDVLTTVAPHLTSKFFYIHCRGVIIACIACTCCDHMLACNIFIHLTKVYTSKCVTRSDKGSMR